MTVTCLTYYHHTHQFHTHNANHQLGVYARHTPIEQDHGQRQGATVVMDDGVAAEYETSAAICWRARTLLEKNQLCMLIPTIGICHNII